jgi:hypothetical protein
MKMDVTELIDKLDSKEINLLLKLYYYHKGALNNSEDFEDVIINSLTDKNLISINIKSNENILDLTDFGLNVCGTVMLDIIDKNVFQFRKEIKKLPERAVSCFVNRILWKDEGLEELALENPFTDELSKNKNIWYERVLLNDERFGGTLESFYNILENLNLIENNDGQRYCLSEVENFLKGEYKNIMNLTWTEEESLKYYQFLYTYFQEQKNLFNLTGPGEYRSMFFSDKMKPANYIVSTINADSKTVIQYLGLNKRRIINFFEDMNREGIVSSRYYPSSSSPIFVNDYTIFVINNARDYMDYINIHFLKPVVDSILS